MNNEIGRLSYSSATELLTCPRKYFLRKVLKLPADPDMQDDTTAFRYGKVYHNVLEKTLHSRNLFKPEMIEAFMVEEGFDPFDANVKYGVATCIEHYYRLREKSGLRAVGFEMEIGNADIIGYIDAVLADINGNWWICDLKTTSMPNPNMYPRLVSDLQLNLYAGFRLQVADKLGLAPEKYMGCLYNVVTKPKMVIRGTESMEQYVARATCVCTEVIIEKDMMNTDRAWKEITQLLRQAREMTEETAICNHSSCFNYFRMCEYYSHCHKKSYTEMLDSLQKFDDTTMINLTEAEELPVI